MHSKQLLLGLLCALQFGLGGAALGAPTRGDQFSFRQPDGTPVEVRIWGDEFYRVVESLDGYTLTRDPGTGEICYARLADDRQSLVSTGLRVDAAAGSSLGLPQHLRIDEAAARALVRETRGRAAEIERAELESASNAGQTPQAATLGNVLGLTVLVDFVDEPATMEPAEIGAFLNQVGYTGYNNNGSVREYFYDVSATTQIYTNYVTPYWYRAQHPKTYYDNCDGYALRAELLIREALFDLEDRGMDFSQFDSNGDGYIDAITCFYAGSTSCPWSTGLTPYSSSGLNFTADGVASYRYTVFGSGSTLYLGVFCHETGHTLCFWRDAYDYDYTSLGIGKFCLMCDCYPGVNPVQPCAYMKVAAGWADVISLNSLSILTADLPAPADSTNTVYGYAGDDVDYFLIENRQQTGRDLYIPDSGLAIWHCDPTMLNNLYEDMVADLHYMVSLEQADGRWDLENGVNSGDDTDLYAAPEFTEFGPDTDPDSDWWSGLPSGLRVRDISASGPTMTFTYDPVSVATVLAKATTFAEKSAPASGFALHRNAPDPFNPITTIRYDLGQACRVRLAVYDLRGRRVRQLRAGDVEPAGSHTVVWDGRDDSGRRLASGAYICRLEAGAFTATQRMMLAQ